MKEEKRATNLQARIITSTEAVTLDFEEAALKKLTPYDETHGTRKRKKFKTESADTVYIGGILIDNARYYLVPPPGGVLPDIARDFVIMVEPSKTTTPQDVTIRQPQTTTKVVITMPEADFNRLQKTERRVSGRVEWTLQVPGKNVQISGLQMDTEGVRVIKNDPAQKIGQELNEFRIDLD